MAISPELRRVYASAPADQRYVETIQLSHPLFPTTFYLTNDPTAWTFDLGDTTLQLFSPVQFQFTRPALDGQGQQDLRLAIDNVGRDATDALEAAAADPTTPITVTVRTYLNVANSAPQATPIVLTMSDITMTTAAISGTASRADTLNRPFPSFVYRPDFFPGLDR